MISKVRSDGTFRSAVSSKTEVLREKGSTMKKRLSALVCIAAATCFGQNGASPDVARLDKVVQSYVDAKQFMGSVLVARGDDVMFSKSYGSANLEWNIANTPATKFRIGSMTKQFTAASILLL